MTHEPQSIEIRVQRVLEQTGYPSIQVEDRGDGRVKLAGPVDSLDDIPLVSAKAQMVPGVTHVLLDLCVGAAAS